MSVFNHIVQELSQIAWRRTEPPGMSLCVTVDSCPICHNIRLSPLFNIGGHFEILDIPAILILIKQKLHVAKKVKNSSVRSNIFTVTPSYDMVPL